jgi:hypothetical protein
MLQGLEALPPAFRQHGPSSSPLMIPSSLLFTPRSDRLSIVFILVPSLKPLELRPPVRYATILDTICPVARPRVFYAKWAPGEEVLLACP